MTVKTFFYGLTASFAIPWLIMIVVPFAKTRNLDPVKFDPNFDGKDEVYEQKFSGRMKTGAEVYRQEGCAVCHTQVVRPLYAGNDVKQAYLNFDKKFGGDYVRITNQFDYAGQEYANIGETRIGQDLANFGSNMDRLVALKAAAEEKFDKEQYFYKRLLNPRAVKGKHWSNCPTGYQFFDEIKQYAQVPSHAVVGTNGKVYVPNSKGQALASFLLNLRMDGAVPYSMQHRHNKLTKKQIEALNNAAKSK